MAACTHADAQGCHNCEIPLVAWWRQYGMRRATFIGSRLTPSFIIQRAAILGHSADRIAQDYPQLTTGQVRKALQMRELYGL